MSAPESVDTHDVNSDDVNSVWPELLLADGSARDDAVLRLRTLMVKAARHQVSYMYPSLPLIGGVRVDDIVEQAADEATVAALGKLSSFEGRSRFTTWAYKFGILHASNEVRRNMWRHREVNLDLVPELSCEPSSLDQHVEHLELAQIVSMVINTVLTPHQRTVAVALLVDDVPIDVLAQRIGSTRNALYKTLFDARGRIRTHLTAAGYIGDVPTTVDVKP
ncbi:MAG: sigma-70 family RNA polymerase sigma factor [Microthrixaceae bacterium]